MSAFFASGRVVDLILLVLALEITAIAAWRWRHKRPIGAFRLACAALPGIFLLLALRAALCGESWMLVALWLALSFPAQLTDWWHRRP